jgi:hypothetical protein
MAFLSGIGKWLAHVVLGWLFDLIKGAVEKYFERKRKEREREEENEEKAKKLEEAKSEQEVIDAGDDLLRR